MERWFSLSLTALLAIALSGCGGSGGDGDGTPSESDDSVDVSFVTRPLSGAGADFNDLSGSITIDGVSRSVEASGHFTARDLQDIEGWTVRPARLLLDMRIPSEGTVVRSIRTAYVTSTGRRIRLEVDDEVSCSPVYWDEAPDAPDRVSAGDSGFLARMTCTNGETRTQRWRATDGGDTLDFTVITESEGPSSSSTLEMTYRFTPEGELHSLHIWESSSGTSRAGTLELSGQASNVREL